MPSRKAADVLFYLAALGFFVVLFRYYLTGAGGPTRLAVTLVPVTFVLWVLDTLRREPLYPRLGPRANAAIAAVYIALSLLVAVYCSREFLAIRTVRAGIWSTPDLLIGGLMAALVMEYARKRHFALFVVNALLILYTVYGWLVPGLFSHPGLSWARVLSAMSVEMTTGVFSRLPQLALTLIGSFILVLSALRAFGCVDSILKGASRLAVKSPHALPQAAVVGSLGVAAISGSGAANAATTGSATIPAMIAAGMPRESAAAIETATSLGGQLMPPVMGISAFIMADFLGRSYFDVVARGYAPALIYFAGVSAAVYLLAARAQTRPPALTDAPLDLLDRLNLLAYAGVIAGLIYLMGVVHLPPMLAALRVFAVAGLALVGFFVVALCRQRREGFWRQLGRPFLAFLDLFAGMTADLTLLLATLSIMTGAFVITGIPTKLGFVLMQAAGVHLVVMLLVAFVFSSLVGTGLPPAPTYIITALVIAPFLIKAGIDPWVVHFYAFFLAVWGELTPPTSVVAAVAARIAEASFFWTMLRATKICIPLFVLMGVVFTRPQLVVEPGLAQLGAFVLVLAGTLGLVFSLHGRYSEQRGPDLLLRLGLAACSLLVLAHPRWGVATAALVPLGGLLGYGWVRSRRRVLAPAGVP
ncbi:MAG: hypothetical protein KatS3mg131_1362 [Candidatus Tectimicrobiota bacterium]|nr:MAG: hypothetical protein KatS3mg131_1362 [Candidatus Tectomicrobia bacterium]